MWEGGARKRMRVTGGKKGTKGSSKKARQGGAQGGAWQLIKEGDEWEEGHERLIKEGHDKERR